MRKLFEVHFLDLKVWSSSNASNLGVEDKQWCKSFGESYSEVFQDDSFFKNKMNQTFFFPVFSLLLETIFWKYKHNSFNSYPIKFP